MKKNKSKVWFMIAMIALIGFVFTSCDDLIDINNGCDPKLFGKWIKWDKETRPDLADDIVNYKAPYNVEFYANSFKFTTSDDSEKTLEFKLLSFIRSSENTAVNNAFAEKGYNGTVYALKVYPPNSSDNYAGNIGNASATVYISLNESSSSKMMIAITLDKLEYIEFEKRTN